MGPGPPVSVRLGGTGLGEKKGESVLRASAPRRQLLRVLPEDGVSLLGVHHSASSVCVFLLTIQ